MTLREPTSDFPRPAVENETEDLPPPVTVDADEAFVRRQPVQAQETLSRTERSEIVVAGSPSKIRKIGGTIKALAFFALGLQEGKLEDLTAQEKEILVLAADATFPKGGAMNMSGTEAGVPEHFENYFRRLPPDKQKLIHLMLHFVEAIPLIFGPKHTLFTLMDEKNREKSLDFADKSLYFHRIALQSLRILLTMGYMANADVQKAVGCVPNTNPFGLK